MVTEHLFQYYKIYSVWDLQGCEEESEKESDLGNLFNYNTLVLEMILKYRERMENRMRVSWMWGRSGCDICHPIDRQGWFGWSGWLGGCPLPPSPLHVRPSRSCALGRRGRPSPIEEDRSSVKGIRVAALPCWSLQTSSQGPFVGERRVVRLPRL